MTDNPSFQDEVTARLADVDANEALNTAARDFMLHSTKPKYSYNFHWLGRPIIQYPQDMVAMQELIWAVRPDLVVETGIAHGGSLILTASMLALLDYCDAVESGEVLDPAQPKRRVVGVDIDIRAHNRSAIEAHPMANRIDMIEGSSTDLQIVEKVKAMAKGKGCVLVLLDSNHTHEHVFGELEAYGELATPGSYCVVFDTIIENLPDNFYPGRTWGPGDSPMSAAREWLNEHPEFEVDRDIDRRLLISVAPEGYLKRVR